MTRLTKEREAEIRHHAMNLIVSELFDEIDALRAELDSAIGRIEEDAVDGVKIIRERDRLQARCERLREALDFYSRVGIPKGATPVGDFESDFLSRDPYWQDQGKIARSSLAEDDRAAKGDA